MLWYINMSIDIQGLLFHLFCILSGKQTATDLLRNGEHIKLVL